MKTQKIVRLTALSFIIMAVTSLSSCLKDSRYVNYAGVTPFVELPLVASNGAFTAAAFNISSTPTLLPLVVNLASPKPPTSPVSVTLAVNAAAVAAYNTANSTNYTLLPAADYSIANLTVTIPAGQNTATLAIMINSSLVDPAGQFLLPITISSAGSYAISVSNTILYNVQAKNQYDGNYVSTGYVFHPSSPRAINATYAFSTAGAASLTAPVADLGTSNYYFTFTIGSGGALSNWISVGATPAAPAAGFMSADNPGGTAYTVTPGPGQAPYVSTTYNNTYDATNKIFWLHFGYQSGSTGQNGYTRQFYMKSVHQ